VDALSHDTMPDALVEVYLGKAFVACDTCGRWVTDVIVVDAKQNIEGEMHDFTYCICRDCDQAFEEQTEGMLP
jgi:hypothetical protein